MLGGLNARAAYLEVEHHALRYWMGGRANAPERVISSLVDLILQDDIARAHEDRRQKPRTVARLKAVV